MPVLGLGVWDADRYFSLHLTRIVIVDIYAIYCTVHSKDGIRLCTMYHLKYEIFCSYLLLP
jgi:hypothetical protein